MRRNNHGFLTGRLCSWLGALLLGFSAWSASNLAEAAPPPEPDATALEYKVKAGYLFNFAKFVEWPAGATNSSDEFRIGIVDDGEVFAVISSALAGKVVQNRKVVTVSVKPGAEAKNCHLVFIARSQSAKVESVLEAIGNAPVLTVSETEKFAAKGGGIGFIMVGENIRFEVNLSAAERAGLKISSKVASMAIIVRKKEAVK